MNAPFDIRKVEAGDESAWRGLWHDYLAFYETTLPDKVYRHTFARLLSDDADAPRGLLAVDGNGPVGLVHYIFHAHCWRPEGICYLQDLFTVPRMRGQGVGRALIGAVYAAADARAVPGVYWLTQDFNHTARKLYDSIGRQTPFIKYQRE